MPKNEKESNRTREWGFLHSLFSQKFAQLHKKKHNLSLFDALHFQSIYTHENHHLRPLLFPRLSCLGCMEKYTNATTLMLLS